MRARRRLAPGPSLTLASLALASVSLGSREALGASFGPDGSFFFDAGATATFSFEEPVPPDGPMAPGYGVPHEAALHGGQVLQLAPWTSVDLPLEVAPKKMLYRATAWVRDQETVAGVDVRYVDATRTDDQFVLYPTGRVTSDGWVEIATDAVRIDGASVAAVYAGFFSPGGGAVDAFELVPLGSLEADPYLGASCEGAVDTVSCAPDQICFWNRCREASGWVPALPPEQDATARFLAARAELFFGPFQERAVDLPNARLAWEAMRTASDPFSFWHGWLLGVRRLHDGHTSTSGIPDVSFPGRKPLTMCFLEGDADASHDLAPKHPDYLDVLVSHVGDPKYSLGLSPGDRLVSIDGAHPIAWARSLVDVHWGMPGISNRVTFAELASGLRGLISRYARELTVIRCKGATGLCSPPETVRVDLLPFSPPGESYYAVQCDNRPLRHLPSSPPSHFPDNYYSVYSGIVNESDPVEAIYGLEWESLSTNGSDGVGPALNAAVSLWKSQANGVILDHRLGYGGTILGPQALWKFAVPRHPLTFNEDRRRAEDEQPSLAAGQARFQYGVDEGLVDYAGVSAPTDGVPVALLITQDVSASDWLPLGMKGQPNHRIFGPFQTNGGFSTRYAFGYWMGMSWVLASGDTYVAGGQTLNGFGVEPDEVVLPKQSDLMIGKDTVYEAALAWVRQEMQAP